MENFMKAILSKMPETVPEITITQMVKVMRVSGSEINVLGEEESFKMIKHK